MKRLTLADFVARASQLYGNKYDYSKVDFVNISTKVCITCLEHGDFWITPNNFFRGHKCPACSNRQRITREVFIARSRQIHKNRYGYNKVQFKNSSNKVCIVCPVHGEFWQIAKYHMQGNGCPKCFATPKSTTEEFIKKAKKIYGDTYDYSRVIYQGNKIKVCVLCQKHGEFWMSPDNHLRGHECPFCYGTPKHTNEEFVRKAYEIHGDKYNYSKVHYNGLHRKVCIICPKHGEFWQSANSHINGSGCPKCSRRSKITLEDFICRSTIMHNGKYNYSKIVSDRISKKKTVQNTYNYSKTVYIGRKEKVCIICPIHGEFWQNPHFHLQGGNCPKCVGGVRLTTEEFIEKANAVHKNKYDYSKVAYRNTSTKVCIICHVHGEFWQTPNNHLFGAGCPACPQSNLEGEVREFLIKNKIQFEQEKGFDWLVFNKKMFLDFFLPEYNVAIECQGRQHFAPTALFGGEEFFQLTVKRDAVKKQLCEKHGIKLLYYSNAHIDYPYPVFESLRLLKEAISQYEKIDLL